MLDTSLRVLLAAVIAVSAVLAALLVYLVVRKALDNRRSRIVARYEEELRVKMYRYLQEGRLMRNMLPHGNRYKFAALEALLAHYRTLLSGSDIQKQIAAFAELAFADIYRKRLYGRQWSLRMNTLYYIDKFAMRSFERELVRLTEAGRLQTQAEFELVLSILASFASDELLPLLSRSAGRISEAMCREILLRVPEERFEPFVARFDSLPPQLQYGVLDVIGLKRGTERIGFLLANLTGTGAELRIRALKALSQMPLLETRADYVNHAASDLWQERMMAAKLFAVVRDRRFLPVLEQLLADSVWWVRQQAAQSILSFHDGRSVLAKVAAFGADRFARDTAEEYLEKEGSGDGDR
ncbi:hypothetical protein SD70_03940 [Gordoniibacillus kamchatkensis]|uniref:HEAT repeat domain-containing protein n=1 Tax=Gordoniibacillus kamchatkensis TaxID=1590651 RepID=A0ABR5ANR4_9BACL|nr:HEAT repeat domain-containing protein [Paenibacillus sp. VKM B-2647]KIL42012.1 hypothetical protein SD70_03940 [Paenibacillus sp. VKM B-2647]